MNFDPDIYTITIRKESVDGETYFVGRVAEFPNVSAYESTREKAFAIVRSALVSIAKRAKETGAELPIPVPMTDADPSGRLTLRMPRSVHAKLNALALKEDASANQLVNTAVAFYLGEVDGLATARAEISMVVSQVLSEQHSQHQMEMLQMTTGIGMTEVTWREVSNAIRPH